MSDVFVPKTHQGPMIFSCLTQTPGTNVIIFYPLFTNFGNKLECLVDQTAKAYQGQTLA
jgi:hypothetical protein